MAPTPGGSDIVIILTLVALEAALSFDNAAILAAIARRLPPAQRSKALSLGLGVAYVLRIAAIALAVVLIKYPLLKALGGGYLIFLFVKHFVQLVRGRANQEDGLPEVHAPHFLERFGMSAFAAAIVTIGMVDVAFAVDQVVAAVALTDKLWLIVVAATIGLLSLRILAPYLARLMDWLPLLEHMAYLAVGFVGGILVYEYLGNDLHVVPEGHIPGPWKVGITLAIFGLPVLWRLTIGRRPRAAQEA